MKRLAILLIVAGVLIAGYPLAERAYDDYRQQRLLAEWTETQAAAPVLPEASAPGGDEAEGSRGNEKNRTSPAVEAIVLGVLEIPAINLRMPLLDGAGEANLRVGAGLMDEGARIGEEGNAIVTAHRAHTYDRLFNRLDEVGPGDGLLISTREAVYRYTVFNTKIVDVADGLGLDAPGGEKFLTLVTCHPLYRVNPPYRLIVQAREIDGKAGDPVPHSDKNDSAPQEAKQ